MQPAVQAVRKSEDILRPGEALVGDDLDKEVHSAQIPMSTFFLCGFSTMLPSGSWEQRVGATAFADLPKVPMPSMIVEFALSGMILVKK